jgi:hypothetical protein
MGYKRQAEPQCVRGSITGVRGLRIVLVSRHVFLDPVAQSIVNKQLRLLFSSRPSSPSGADSLIHRASGLSDYLKPNGVPFG